MSNPYKRQKIECGTPPFYPVLSSDYTQETPLTEVYTATIVNRKNISKVILELNATLPLPSLSHLKRIKGNDIILFEVITEYDEEQVFNVLEKENSSSHYFASGSICKKKVAKIPPVTRKQYEVVNKLWPCNFHSNPYLEKLCTNNLFSSDEIEAHICFMRIALDVAQLSTSDIKVGTVIVDPNINSVVAIGPDQRNSNPCKHASMVAIDGVAISQNGGVWRQASCGPENETKLDTRGVPSEILTMLKVKYSNVQFGARIYKNKSDIQSPTDGPYLCTGYTVYVTSEPCIMCAMALIHSRVKRVFYSVKSERGALGTLCKIHVVKDLNHRYEVFGGLLEEDCKKLNHC